MDLYAYMISQAGDVARYIESAYGKVPRMRGVRFMKIETPDACDDDTYQGEMFRRHCGDDVVYIHTRCGSAWWGDDDESSNYISCGGREWEEANADTFIESCNDEFDGTYRDHYFKAVVCPEYDKIVADIAEARE